MIPILICFFFATAALANADAIGASALLTGKSQQLIEDIKRFAEDNKILVVKTDELTKGVRRRSDDKQGTDVCETVWVEYLKKLDDVSKQQAQYDGTQNKIKALKKAIEMEKIDTCREYIAGFGDPLKIKGSSSLMGTFMKDLADGRDEIWISEGCCELKLLTEYKSLTDFQNSKVYRKHEWPTGNCDGTGHVIYDGHLICNVKNSNSVKKYDLNNRTNVVEVSIPNAGFHNTYPYQFYGYSDLDLAIDEQGLWVVYSTPQNNGNMVISRLDLDDLSILATYNTHFPKKSAGNTFMACGVLYATSSYVDSPTYVMYMYDTNDGTEHFLNEDVLPMRVNDYGNGRTSTFMLDYNAKDKLLYAWTYMNQITYKVFRKF